jgi:hypothetical protein
MLSYTRVKRFARALHINVVDNLSSSTLSGVLHIEQGNNHIEVNSNISDEDKAVTVLNALNVLLPGHGDRAVRAELGEGMLFCRFPDTPGCVLGVLRAA